MSISRLFTIIGDQNVRRNMTGLNVASREVMKSAQVLDCSSMTDMDSRLNEVRPESEVLILASITEFLLSSGDCGTIYSSIDPVLTAFASKVVGFCAYRRNLKASISFITFVKLLRMSEFWHR